MILVFTVNCLKYVGISNVLDTSLFYIKIVQTAVFEHQGDLDNDLQMIERN